MVTRGILRLSLNHPQCGFSLIELLMAVGLFAVMVFFTAKVFIFGNEHLIHSLKQTDVVSELSLVHKFLQKRFVSDLRFYAFTGKVDEPPLSRFIVPADNRCVNFNSCPHGASLFFNTFDRNQDFMISSICYLSSPSGQISFVLDGRQGTYGFDMINGSSVALGDKSMDLSAGSMIFSLSVPIATLWRVSASPHPMIVTDVGGVLTYNGQPLPVECINNLTQDAAGSPLVDRLVELQVHPFFIKDFTGGMTLSQEAVSSVLNQFPQKVSLTRMVGLGSWPAQEQQGMELRLAYCDVTEDSHLFCQGNPLYRLGTFDSISILEGFSLKLKNTVGVQEDFDFYEITEDLSSLATMGVCSSPNCKTLGTGPLGAFQRAAPANETYESLSGAQFSLLKQDTLKKIKIVFRTLDGKYENLSLFLQ